MTRITIDQQDITVYSYNTVIVGAGAAGMNCAVNLYENMAQQGISDPAERIAVITAGLPLGASRMSGSDKQTYYKLGTSPETADSAEEFARSLTAGGCCHSDLALAEAIGSLRGFYHLVQAGVPFPHDSLGTYIGYKTDHDPYERATSAGPKTSKMMSECLEKIVRRYGVAIHDGQEVAHLLTIGSAERTRIVGVLTVDRKALAQGDQSLNLYYCHNLVLAAGGPGALYETSVYPKGQTGIHGIALRAGLAAENLTESQFGLASTKFRWNVSGTYMQVIPRIFSTDIDGNDPREFLTGFFPSMSKMADNIFLKGYQWPFDPQRIEGLQSSLIDVIVFNETQKGRRVFLDFRSNPIGSDSMQLFRLDDLDDEPLHYLKNAGAMQSLPIERLAHMNQPAIDIYKEHNIDLHSEPLEIAVCAQHNNGGFAVDRWWQSNIPHTFIIGEMAGTHGVKRPGGSALNAGQVGAQRAAEYIAHACGTDIPTFNSTTEISEQLNASLVRLRSFNNHSAGLTPAEAIKQTQHRMTTSAGHIRESADANRALTDALTLYRDIQQGGLHLKQISDLATAIQAEHLSLAAVAYLKAVVELLNNDSGSRGSHLVLSADGIEIHNDIIDRTTGKPLRFKPENERLRSSILRITFDTGTPELFTTATVAPRPALTERKAFEPAWQDYRDGIVWKS